MPFIKRFNSYFTIFSMLITVQIANASVFEQKCGEYIYRAETLDGLDNLERRYKLYYVKAGQKPVLFYETPHGFGIYVACVHSKKQQNIFLFQEHCGGNATSEERYGAFDPDTKKMLLKETDCFESNYKQAKKLLGYNPPYLFDNEISFCCDKKQETN